MRLLICGDREWTNQSTIHSVLTNYDPNTTTVITGGARGADKIAHFIASELKMQTEVYEADWVKFGKSAGPIRNSEMINKGKPDVVIAFHSDLSKSKGTADTVRRAKKLNIPVFLFTE